MLSVAVWCRHEKDCIIGIGPKIPWFIKSDLQRFRRITSGASIVAGQTTYESFPNRTLPNRKIYVLTFDKNYKVSDENNHFVINDLTQLPKDAEVVYICGGASVYKAFMKSGLVDVVVDSCYHGKLDESLVGNPVDIHECIDIMNQNYEKISKDYLEDDVTTAIFVKKGIKISDNLLEHLNISIFNVK
ncbi:MAG: dihydrofolate reductase [Alphaproteobacteria bacterium]|nr:dihydrofolate reductase [Alphaproteobacteria bacterium]